MMTKKVNLSISTALQSYRWPSGQPRTGPCQARPDGGWAGTARRASRAVPSWASCLTNGPDTVYWAVFWAGPAREARPIWRTVLARGPRGSAAVGGSRCRGHSTMTESERERLRAVPPGATSTHSPRQEPGGEPPPPPRFSPTRSPRLGTQGRRIRTAGGTRRRICMVGGLMEH